MQNTLVSNSSRSASIAYGPFRVDDWVSSADFELFAYGPCLATRGLRRGINHLGLILAFSSSTYIGPAGKSDGMPAADPNAARQRSTARSKPRVAPRRVTRHARL